MTMYDVAGVMNARTAAPCSSHSTGNGIGCRRRCRRIELGFCPTPTATAKKSKRSLYFSCAATSCGVSASQFSHHSAQNSSNTGLRPNSSPRSTGRPSRSSSRTGCAGVPLETPISSCAVTAPAGHDEANSVSKPLRRTGPRHQHRLTPTVLIADALGREFDPAEADCGYRAPLAPRLARPPALYLRLAELVKQASA